jgi:dienelactone hydrolase
MPPTRRRLPHLLAVPFAVLLAVGVAATSDEAGSAQPPFPAGELVEGVATLTDPGETYTLYLPSGYRGEPAAGEAGEPPPRRWPALLVFDPRGRSRQAAELFVAGAERFGWIVLSADGTRSDGPWEPNVRAVNALLPELDRRFAVDPRRVYAAGFSGGAHVAWLLGLGGGLAGVIGSGGRDSPEWMTAEVPFASYGAAGATDFNFAGMHAVDAHFASRGAPHRLEVFEGRHQWLPAELAAEAIGWLEVVAMAQGRRPVDRELAVELLRAETAAARALEDAGELLRAAGRYGAVVRTWTALVEDAAVAEAAARLAVLEASPAYRAAVRERQKWDSFEAAWHSRLGAALLELRGPQDPASPQRLAARWEIPRLLRLAADGESATARRTAQRMLETAFVQTSFYLHRDFRAEQRYRHAALVLEVAAQIRPGAPGVLYNLACAQALAGRRDKALDALRAAVDAGFADRRLLATDPDLESLRASDAYRRIAAALPAAAAP